MFIILKHKCIKITSAIYRQNISIYRQNIGKYSFPERGCPVPQILILGNDIRAQNDIFRYFSKKDAVIIMGESVYSYGSKHLIVFNPKHYHTNKSRGVLLFLNDNIPIMPDFSAEGFIALCGSQNKKALEFLMKKNISTITCGMMSTDTITFSSLEKNSRQISLQRSIKTIDDSIAEAGDFKSVYSSNYPLSELFLTAFEIMLNLH